MPAFSVFTLLAHVTLGTLAVVMGAIALGARKGRKAHVGAGRLFVVSMGAASALGALLGALRYETHWITFHAGLLGLTLEVSGVLALRLRQRGARRWFAAIAVVNALNAAALFAAGCYATTLQEAGLFGFAAGDYFFLCAMAAIACGGDLRMLSAAVVSNGHRIAQHLMRMCIGFFIAAGSAFTGPGAAVFPKALRDTGLLSVPELSIILLMLFWLWRTRRQLDRA